MSATLTVRIAADINSFSGKLSKVEKDFVRAMKTIEKAGERMSLTVTAPLLALGTAFAKSAADDAASVDRLKHVFGSASEEMENFIKQVMKTIPETDDALRELTGTTQNFLTQLGIAPKSATAMTQTLTKLAADMAAFNHVDIGTAMDALEKGLAGKTKGLTSMGIVISEVMIKQEAYRLGLAKVGHDLSQTAVAQATLSLVTQKMGNQMGEAARTAGDASKSWGFFKQSVDNLADSMGAVLVPAMSRGLQIITGAANRISEMGTTGKLTVTIFGGMAAAIGPLLVGLGSIARAVTVLRASALGLGGSLAAGGAVIVGLTLLAYMLSKSGEAARNAKRDADNYRSSLIGLTADQLKWQQIQANLALKIAQKNLASTPKRVTIGSRAGRTEVANPAFAEATQRLDAARNALGQVKAAIDSLNDTAAPTRWVPPTITDLKAAEKAFQEFTERTRTALQIFEALAAHGTESKTVNSALVSSYDTVASKLREIGDVASVTRLQLLELQAAMMENIVVAQHVNAINSTGSVGPLAGKSLPQIGAPVTNAAIGDAADKLTNGPMSHAAGADPVVKHLTSNADKNANLMRDAIASSAQTIAGAIGAALNIGGGGRGSQIGGAIASGIGGALGTKIGGGVGSFGGPILGAVGGVVGGLIGSAIGGLFDHHKKSVDRNTAAVNALTAMFQNAPSGFRVEPYRYDASTPVAYPYGRRPRSGAAGSGNGDIVFQGDVHFHGVQDLDSLGRQVRSRAARGGPNPLITASA